MADLNNILAELQRTANDPQGQLAKYLSEGREVIGCFPIYTPEVIADAAGLVPMGLWGGQTEFLHAKKYLVPFICPIMQSCMELGITGRYRGIRAVMIPTMCDTLRCVTQDFKNAVKDIVTIPFTLPQNRGMQAALDFLQEEYGEVRRRIEEVYGVTVTDEAMERSIAVYNEHNAAMRAFTQLANDHLDIITPTVRHAVMKSAWFMTKGEHTALVRALNDGLRRLPVHEFTGRRVVLTGITAEPDSFLRILEDNRMAVVADDLAHESRQWRTDIPDGGAPLERLARQWANRTDPMAHAETFRRTELLTELCRQSRADAVLVCLMKFCDPEEYEYVQYSRDLKQAGIPLLSIDIDQQPTDYSQARTRIETLNEIL